VKENPNEQPDNSSENQSHCIRTDKRSNTKRENLRCVHGSGTGIRPHSIILASCKPGFRPGLQSGFRQVRAGLRHAFDQLSTFLSAGSLVRACARQMECRKKLVLSKFAAGFRHAFDQVFDQVCSWLE